VHDAGGVLKQYLRRLPEPLIPFDFYARFIQIAQQYKASAERNPQFRDLLKQIPKENYVLLCRLCRFLLSVSQHKDVNKMSPDNLAIVFAPNLLRPKEDMASQSILSEMPIGIAVINSFITDFADIFDESAAPAQ